jgi:hypothetical protein
VARKADQSVCWSKRENSLLYHYEGQKPTSMLIAHVFEGVTMGQFYNYAGRIETKEDERTFTQELDARGYDLTTLKFSIYKKEPLP